MYIYTYDEQENNITITQTPLALVAVLLAQKHGKCTLVQFKYDVGKKDLCNNEES